MIEQPDHYLEAFAKAGASWISVHAEACPHLQRTLARIRSLGVLAGVALNPATPESSLEYVIEDLDFVLVMSVNPGFGGQKFIPSSLKKIRALKEMIEEAGTDCFIEVDGGVNSSTAPKVKAAGAQVLVAGSAVYDAQDYRAAIEEIKGNPTK